MAVGACAVMAADRPDASVVADVRALRWVAEGSDAVRALTSLPPGCSPPEAAEGAPVSAERIGQLVFDSPALLGGAAGRMGLSCSSCHPNGRTNPDFFLDGVAGAPGTADVTSSRFSKVRDNGVFDPVTIPDISARDGRQIVDRKSEAFRRRVHGLVVDEFEGQEPPPGAFADLLAYLDSLTPACTSGVARVPLTAATDVNSARDAFAGAVSREGADRRLLVRVARERLERLHERFLAADVRVALVDASRAIDAWSAEPDAVHLQGAVSSLRAAGERAMRQAERSLYDPATLSAALARGKAQTP